MTTEANPHEEARELRARLAQIDQRIALGRPLTPGSGEGGRLTRDDLVKMPADELNARWDDVQEALRAPK